MFGKISLLSIITVGVITFTVFGMHAESSTPLLVEAETVTIPLPQTLSTHTWGVFDPQSGEIIAGENTDTPYPIASVSKLFTATAVMRSSKKDEPLIITVSDVNTEGRAGKLVAGTKTTPYELLFPLLLESSNDAGVAIVRALGAEFSDTIAQVTDSLTLRGTHISEPTGLSPKNVSTVTDLVTFYTYLKKSYPHILDITELNTYIDERVGYRNSDPARKISTFRGGKQGFTDEAGRTFIGTFTLPNSHDEIGIVILKSNSLLSDIAEILRYAESLSNASDILKP